MNWLESVLSVILITFYLVCLVTVCRLTFQKGHTLLGIVGIFLPFLWLIGAILPAKPGSRVDIAAHAAQHVQTQPVTT